MYVMGIWKNVGLGNQSGLGNNEDIIYNYLSAGNLGWLGLRRSIIHSIPSADYYWDCISIGEKIKMKNFLKSTCAVATATC